MRQLFLEGRALHIFPCRPDKKPTTPHGHLDAVSDPASIAKLWARYPGPLVGVATGAVGGIDVIDVDEKGEGWFHAHRDQLPATRTHKTPRGLWHFIYHHAIGLRCSTSKIAPGIDIKADGGYIIWWPASLGRVVCEGPVADFPAWLSENGMAVTTKPDRSDVTPILPVGPPSLYQINYAKRSLGNACFELRHCPEGSRNTTLNALAYKMGRLIGRGWIRRELVESYLLNSCEACGLLADDGAAQCRATLASGINAGTTRPYHDIGPRHD
jgi:Bifunctional DNA primase/polymerase, N-terminal